MVEEGWCRDGVAASICVATTSLRLITHGQKQEETANPPGGCNASNHAISFDKAAEPMHSKTYVCVSAIGEQVRLPELTTCKRHFDGIYITMSARCEPTPTPALAAVSANAMQLWLMTPLAS